MVCGEVCSCVCGELFLVVCDEVCGGMCVELLEWCVMRCVVVCGELLG